MWFVKALCGIGLRLYVRIVRMIMEDMMRERNRERRRTIFICVSEDLEFGFVVDPTTKRQQRNNKETFLS